jgi:hypothetical protein
MLSEAVFYGLSADLSTSTWLSSNFNIFCIYIQLKKVAKATKEEPHDDDVEMVQVSVFDNH